MVVVTELTCLAQWWASSEVTVYVENKDDIALLGKEHVLVLMNHKYDIDWLMTWILAERFQMLGVSCAVSNSPQIIYIFHRSQ